jgi:Rrf2 family protein
MRLTRGTDYGLLGIIYLAQQPMNYVALVSEVSLARAIPESYLAKIFQELAKSGLLRSFRGARGGFALARDPNTITLRQIIEALEGPIAINRCLDPREGCEHIETCRLYRTLAQAQQEMLQILDHTTLYDVANGSQASGLEFRAPRFLETRDSELETKF